MRVAWKCSMIYPSLFLTNDLQGVKREDVLCSEEKSIAKNGRAIRGSRSLNLTSVHATTPPYPTAYHSNTHTLHYHPYTHNCSNYIFLPSQSVVRCIQGHYIEHIGKYKCTTDWNSVLYTSQWMFAHSFVTLTRSCHNFHTFSAS